ncbi:hypothetical protein BV737P3_00042 [Phocaeicola phage BV737P3]|nr:hypothetical protein BV737P3_00042 [Phocaeicola phage BV737P3]
MKSDNGILDNKELEKRTKFWNKKTFRAFTQKELNRDSLKIQSVLVAIKDLTLEEIKAERNKPRGYVYHVSTLRSTSWETIEYAISIAPKSFKVKQS